MTLIILSVSTAERDLEYFRKLAKWKKEYFMVKAIMDIEMPICCDDCIMHTLTNSDNGNDTVIMYCRIAKDNNKNVPCVNRKKPDWCPLEEA